MCSGNEDCPAVTWTSNGLYKIKKLSSKISSWIEQIDLIHTQINSDINNRETALSNNTKALIINLFPNLMLSQLCILSAQLDLIVLMLQQKPLMLMNLV